MCLDCAQVEADEALAALVGTGVSVKYWHEQHCGLLGYEVRREGRISK